MLTEEQIKKAFDGFIGFPPGYFESSGYQQFARAIEQAVRQEMAADREDAERLNWMLEHPDATVCAGGSHGPYHIWFRYSNRITEERPTARAAIDQARKAP